MNSKFEKRTVLLDAHAIIHRAYHAMPDFSTRDGRPTGGLYGVCTMLMKIIDELQPDYIIACYDLPKPTFRHAAYDDYKAGRTESEDNLKTQLQSSRDIFKAFNIPIYEQEGYEADDLLGTLAEQIKQDPTQQIIIASGDMDTMQLIDGDQVQVYTLKKGINDTIMYNEEAVVERFGFGSYLIPDYKGLAGDSSDNIKGVAGIGAKTATTLVSSFGTVEEILEAIDTNEQHVVDAGVTKRMVGLVRDNSDDALFSKELATIKCDVDVQFDLPSQVFRDGINLATAGELFRDLEFRNMMSRLEQVLGIKESGQESLLVDDSNIDPTQLHRAKLAAHLLNPVVSNPSLDDVLRYGEDFDSAYREIQSDIKRDNLNFVLDEIEMPISDAICYMNNLGFVIDQKHLQALSKQFHQKITEIETTIHSLAGEPFNIKSTQQLSRVLFETLELPTKGIKKTPKGVLSTKESELQKLEGQHEIIDLILQYRELTKLTSTYIDNLLPMINQETGRLSSTFVTTGTTTGRMSSRDPNLQNIPTGGSYGHLIRQAFVAQAGYQLVAMDYSQIELRMAAQLSQDEKLITFFKDGRDIHSAVAQEIFGNEDGDSRRKAKVINFGILYGMGANALRGNLGGETTLAEAREYLDAYFERFPTLASYLKSSKQFARDHKYSLTLFGRRRNFSDIDSKIPFIRAAAERMAVNAPIQGTATADVIKLAMRDCWEYIQSHTLQDEVHLIAQVHDELIFEISSTQVNNQTQKLQEIMESVLERYAPQVNQEALVPLVVGIGTGSNWSETK